MHELSALVALRERICHRLREMPYEAATEQELVRLFGSLEAVERRVTERTSYLVAVLALDSAPEILLAVDPRRWPFTEKALEAVAQTFAEEIAQLRALFHGACRQVQSAAEVQTLAARLVEAFIMGAPCPSRGRHGRDTGA